MSPAAVRHVVLFTWREGTTAPQIEAVRAALLALPGIIPQILDYRLGPDLGVNQGNAHFAVAADFASVDDYLVYRDHPEHRRVITELLVPIIASRAAVQLNL